MKKFLLATTGLAGCLLPVYSALAQTATSTPPEAAVNNPTSTNAQVGAPTPGADGAERGGIQDIVVTAQRRSENLQRAAIAVSAISGDALAAAGITRPTELTAVIPSLQVAPAAGPYNLFYLRGVGNFNANAFSDSAVAFNVDGVYIGRPSSTTGFFYDLERVEVVKGPQGTLYGRNATGGAINVISKKPELGHFGASGSIDYGNYNALRLDAAINLPLSDIAALRLSGIRVKHNGYMNDGTDDQNDYGGRASFRVDPAKDLKINVVADYFHQGGNGVGSTPLLAPRGVANGSTFNVDDRIGFFSPAGQAFYTSQRAGTLGRNFYAFPAGFESFQRNRYFGVSTTVEWQTPVGTLTVIPAYREAKLDYQSYGPGFQIRQIEKSKQTSLEARFATPESQPIRALVGAFYFKDKTRDPAESYASNWNAQYDRDLRLETESKAIFGRLTYAVTPAIRLNVGARQTWEDKSFSGTRTSITRLCGLPPIQNCPTAPPLPFGTTPPGLTGPGQAIVPPFGPPPYGGFPDLISNPQLVQTALILSPNEQGKFKKFTWRAGADWDITPRNLLYAGFETGFKSGGFFFSPATGVFAPEAIKAFTVGSKNRFFDNRLQLNLEVFHWRYSNQQISHLITILGVPTFATENVGRATFKGAEVEARVAATATTMLTADIQYLDAKYDSFVYLQTNSNGGSFNGTSCPSLSVSASAYTVDCSGKRPPNAPEWTLNLGVQQKLIVPFGEFVIDARAHYQTSTLTGLDFVPVEYQKAYWLADAQLTYNPRSRHYYLGAYVNNIFDETVKSQIFPTPGTNFYSTTLRPPRTYGVRAGFKF